MDYNQFLTYVGELTSMGADDTDLLAILPAGIEYVEGRIYRDPFFDFLETRTASTSVCTINNRAVTKPAALLSLDSINLITPAGSVPDATNSSKNPLQRVSLPYVDAVWSGAAGVTGMTGQPVVIAALNDTTFKLGPVPDAAYVIEWVGPTMPDPLSEANPNTYLTANMPELYLAGAMVFLSGWMMSFGAQASDPAQAVSWEQQYGTLKIGPQVQEARRKSEAQAWSTQPPAMVAKPDRS